jgi:hypothetical protein
LSPRHPDATELSEKVIEFLGGDITHVRCEEDDIRALRGNNDAKLREARAILLIDDVTITGKRLDGYKNALLSKGYTTIKTKKLLCLVGVARPSDFNKLTGIKRMFSRDNIEYFDSVETILLPDWGKKQETDNRADCPWCWEFRQLEAIDAATHRSKQIRDRYDLLKNTEDGIQHSPFLPWTETKDYRFLLGPGSNFGDNLTDVELFAAVASTLQYLRNEGILYETYNPPVAKVLNPYRFLRAGYHDPIIRAAVLRAAKVHDFRSGITDVELLEILNDLYSMPPDAPLMSEITLAMAQSKLPKPPDITDRIKRFHGNPAVRRYLSKLVDQSSDPTNQIE